jgi:rhodanese-related sulfurtransferase
MRQKRFWIFLALALGLFQAGYLQCLASNGKTPMITKEELKSMLGNPDVIIIDVRLDTDWEKSDSKIKGAVREDPEGDVQAWAEKYPKSKTIVFY